MRSVHLGHNAHNHHLPWHNSKQGNRFDSGYRLEDFKKKSSRASLQMVTTSKYEKLDIDSLGSAMEQLSLKDRVVTSPSRLCVNWKCILIAGLIFGMAGPCSAANLESCSLAQPISIRYMTWNVCNIPKMDYDPKYVEFKFARRLEKIGRVIKEVSPDIIGFQEIRDTQEASVMADLWTLLRPLGYRLEQREGNPSELSVYNVLAYKMDRIWLQNITSWWNSETPEQESCSYGNGWPRVVVAGEFYPIKIESVTRRVQETGKVITFSRPAPDYTALPVVVVNSHLGLGIGASLSEEKVLSNEVTVKKIEGLVGSRPVFVVSLGDFNTFPDSEKLYQEEMNVYASHGFKDCVTESPLKDQNGITIKGSFLGYTYDAFKSGEKEFGSSLDHIWYRLFNEKKTDRQITIQGCHAITLIGDENLDRRKVSTEEELLWKDEKSLRDQYPSDHLPLVFDIAIVKRDCE